MYISAPRIQEKESYRIGDCWWLIQDPVQAFLTTNGSLLLLNAKSAAVLPFFCAKSAALSTKRFTQLALQVPRGSGS